MYCIVIQYFKQIIFHYKVITRQWLYFLCCTVYSVVICFILNLYLICPSLFPLPLVTTSLWFCLVFLFCLYVIVFLKISYISDIINYLSFRHLTSIIFSRFTPLWLANGRNSFLYGLDLYPIDIPHLLNPVIFWWAFVLFSCLGYCINSAAVNTGVCVFFQINIFNFWIYIKKQLLDHMVVLF